MGMDLDKDIENLVAKLDDFGLSDVSRLKVSYSDSIAAGEMEKQYHHGRCDVNSPWANGCAFDVIEE